MKSIKINAKLAPKMEQFLPKIEAGFKNIEIQLINEFVGEQEYENTRNAINNYNANITVVHTPLISGKDTKAIEISLNHLLDNHNFEIFKDTCKYAQYISELENHRIKVVVHNDYSEENWQETDLIKEKIGPRVKDVLNEYNNVDIVLENSSSYGDGKYGFKTISSMSDVSYAIKELNEFIPGRIESLIDTCHILIGWELWKRILGSSENISDWNEEFKKATQYSSIGLIHLNNIRDNGCGKNHGTAFDYNEESNVIELKAIMQAYEKYANCDITIEVREDNYNEKPNNLIITKNCLEKLGYNVIID